MVNNIARCILQMWNLRHAEAKEPAEVPRANNSTPGCELGLHV